MRRPLGVKSADSKKQKDEQGEPDQRGHVSGSIGALGASAAFVCGRGGGAATLFGASVGGVEGAKAFNVIGVEVPFVELAGLS